MPTFVHGDVTFDIDDDWWTEAGMADYVCRRRRHSYPPRKVTGARKDAKVFLVELTQIEPVQRDLSHGVFNDGDRTARERVTRILTGFKRRHRIPPVEVVRSDVGPFSFTLYHGVHRFYCSIAAGFSHIPAIDVTEPIENSVLVRLRGLKPGLSRAHVKRSSR